LKIYGEGGLDQGPQLGVEGPCLTKGFFQEKSLSAAEDGWFVHDFVLQDRADAPAGNAPFPP
jgi:hypothetical protein